MPMNASLSVAEELSALPLSHATPKCRAATNGSKSSRLHIAQDEEDSSRRDIPIVPESMRQGRVEGERVPRCESVVFEADLCGEFTLQHKAELPPVVPGRMTIHARLGAGSVLDFHESGACLGRRRQELPSHPSFKGEHSTPISSLDGRTSSPAHLVLDWSPDFKREHVVVQRLGKQTVHRNAQRGGERIQRADRWQRSAVFNLGDQARRARYLSAEFSHAHPVTASRLAQPNANQASRADQVFATSCFRRNARSLSCHVPLHAAIVAALRVPARANTHRPHLTGAPPPGSAQSALSKVGPSLRRRAAKTLSADRQFWAASSLPTASSADAAGPQARTALPAREVLRHVALFSC